MKSPIQFAFPCPTSSALRAQLWFELRSRGLRVLTIGLALATDIALLFASGRGGRAFGMIFATLFMPAVLLIGGNAFGLRRGQGGKSVSAFEATQPHGTLRLAFVKLIVWSACFLTAVGAVWTTAWICLSRYRFVKAGAPLMEQQVNTWMVGREDAFLALPGNQQLALVFVVLMGIVLWVAIRGVVRASWVRNFRYVIVAASLPLLYLLGGVAYSYGFVPEVLRPVLEHGTRWVFEAAIVVTTIYLLRSGLTEGLLTRSYVWGVVLVSAVFAVAWLAMLQASGFQFAKIPPVQFDARLFPVLL